MVATIPASVVFRNTTMRSGVAGTVWNGEVGIAGGSALRWNWAPLRSLLGLGFAADWKAAGPDTDLGGQALAGFSTTRFDHVSGSAPARLLEAIQPTLPFTCDLNGQVEMEKVVLRGSGKMMQGRMVSDPGSCQPKSGGVATAVPSLLLTAEKTGNSTRIRVAPSAQRLKTLIDVTMAEDGAMTITVTPEGASMLPFLGAPPAGAKVQAAL
ncbi:MAG: type II secretion system protein N [Sphingomonas sp.]|nr:type II secretion system protein N [Sphingomonas sp.]